MNNAQARSGPADATPSKPARPVWNWRILSASDVATLAVVAAALGFAYWANFQDLFRTWNREPDYSHGFLVLPIALVILYRLWPSDGSASARPWLPGLLLVVVGLGLRAWFQERGQNWSETATVLIVVFGLGLARIGARTMRLVWPAFAFLLFWMPLPPSINSMLSQPLQSAATKGACFVLKTTGLWVMPEGNVIMVGAMPLEVATACNGLSMLMSLAAAVAATASILPMATFKRLVLLLSIIPIALASNILRIAATAWCYYQFGADVGSKYAHDGAGWLMMPTAMIFVGLELKLMSWLVVESRVAVDRSFQGNYAAARPAYAAEGRR